MQDSQNSAKDPSKVRKVLVVEDDPIIANLVEMFLSRKGYTICGKAETGEFAIARAAEEQPDLVLMDIGLRGELDGIFAAKYILNAFNIPVVFLTGNSDDETIRQATKAEPFGFITKPFGDTDLYSSIEIALYNHTMRNRILKSGPAPIRKMLDMLDAVLLADYTGRVFFMNSYAEVLLNIRAADAVPRQLGDLVAFIDTRTGREYEDPMREVIKESMLVGMDKHVTVVTREGQKKDVLLTARPMKDTAEEIIGVMIRIHRKTPSEQRLSRVSR
ncbi:MAG: response regulator [Methanoregulaceae archaeon]